MRLSYVIFSGLDLSLACAAGTFGHL